mmetsp:Transcript_17931/g.41356  ORF Transcript_17931/g.41356 Transcript_17931/m.41356 type:complete len:231 (-) Transcript_17931:679-1371(-)
MVQRRCLPSPDGQGPHLDLLDAVHAAAGQEIAAGAGHPRVPVVSEGERPGALVSGAEEFPGPRGSHRASQPKEASTKESLQRHELLDGVAGRRRLPCREGDTTHQIQEDLLQQHRALPAQRNGHPRRDAGHEGRRHVADVGTPGIEVRHDPRREPLVDEGGRFLLRHDEEERGRTEEGRQEAAAKAVGHAPLGTEQDRDPRRKAVQLPVLEPGRGDHPDGRPGRFRFGNP